MLITGGSQQSPEWSAQNDDGWMTYPRNTAALERVIADWRANIAAADLADKPVMQPLYIDLTEDPNSSPQPIHLGFRSGVNHLRQYLESHCGIGVNHVALNLRFNQVDIETTLHRLADGLIAKL